MDFHIVKDKRDNIIKYQVMKHVSHNNKIYCKNIGYFYIRDKKLFFKFKTAKDNYPPAVKLVNISNNTWTTLNTDRNGLTTKFPYQNYLNAAMKLILEDTILNSNIFSLSLTLTVDPNLIFVGSHLSFSSIISWFGLRHSSFKN